MCVHGDSWWSERSCWNVLGSLLGKHVINVVLIVKSQLPLILRTHVSSDMKHKLTISPQCLRTEFLLVFCETEETDTADAWWRLEKTSPPVVEPSAGWGSSLQTDVDSSPASSDLHQSLAACRLCGCRDFCCSQSERGIQNLNQWEASWNQKPRAWWKEWRSCEMTTTGRFVETTLSSPNHYNIFRFVSSSSFSKTTQIFLTLLNDVK